MSPQKKLARYLVIPLLILFVSLACELFHLPGMENIPGNPTSSPVPTPLCGGDVTGAWSGTAGEGNEAVTYSMNLVQKDCTVSGTSRTEGSISASVNGSVDQGIFHFTESGSGNNCYWTGNLSIKWPFDQMTGKVTNCSGKQITLYKR